MPQEHTKRIRNTTVRMGLSGDMAMATKQSTRKRDQIRYEKPALELVCPEKMLRKMLYANVCRMRTCWWIVHLHAACCNFAVQ